MIPGISLTKRAESDIRALDPQVAVRVIDAIADFASSGSGDVKKLKGADNEYRLRIGDWRVRFERIEAGVYRVLRVLHRREAYRQ